MPDVSKAALDSKRWGIKNEAGDEQKEVPFIVVERQWKTEDAAAWSMLN
jgi:hypothetical protein